MDDLKELFDSLDRLEAPDLWLEADRRRPGAVRLGRDRSRLLAAVVAFAVAIPAVFLAIRAFQAPEEPVAPVRSPSASTTEARCPQATTSGDFDGDGTADEATFFEIVPQGVTCAQGGQVVTHLLGQEVVIWFGSGIVLRQPFTDCRGGECAFVFAATDLDDDGRDELAIDVTSAGAIGLVEFYRVDPAGIRPIVIAEPGDPPYVEPGPAVLGGGFDSGVQSPIVCEVGPTGTRRLVSIHAEALGDTLGGPWHVHTTTMVLQGDELRVISEDDVRRGFSMGSEVFRNGCA